MRAQRPAVQSQLAFDLVVDLAGNADAAGLGDPFQPCCNVDAVAKNIVVVEDDVTDMNADAKFDPEVVRHVAILHGHTALDFRRALHRLYHAWELGQQAVAGGLDDAAAVPGDGGIDQRSSDRLQPDVRALLVAAHQTAVAGNIRRQHRR